MAIRVKFLANNGCVVKKRRYGRMLSRFVRPNGTLSSQEAVAALNTNDMQLLRLQRRGKLKVRVIGGIKHFRLSDIKRLKRDRRELYPGRNR